MGEVAGVGFTLDTAAYGSKAQVKIYAYKPTEGGDVDGKGRVDGGVPDVRCRPRLV